MKWTREQYIVQDYSGAASSKLIEEHDRSMSSSFIRCAERIKNVLPNQSYLSQKIRSVLPNLLLVDRWLDRSNLRSQEIQKQFRFPFAPLRTPLISHSIGQRPHRPGIMRRLHEPLVPLTQLPQQRRRELLPSRTPRHKKPDQHLRRLRARNLRQPVRMRRQIRKYRERNIIPRGIRRVLENVHEERNNACFDGAAFVGVEGAGDEVAEGVEGVFLGLGRGLDEGHEGGDGARVADGDLVRGRVRETLDCGRGVLAGGRGLAPFDHVNYGVDCSWNSRDQARV